MCHSVAMRILTDPIFRRFFLGALFTAIFVWVAVRFYEVPTEVVWVFFVFSVGFVAMAIGLGAVGSVAYRIWRRYRRSDGLVDRLGRGEMPKDEDFRATEPESVHSSEPQDSRKG
mgnify:CR=1 FL=1